MGRERKPLAERRDLRKGIWGPASVREVSNLNGKIKFLNRLHPFFFF